MDTKSPSPQRNHHVSHPKSLQCPKCGRYHPQQRVHYENPRTGMIVRDKEIENIPRGCFIWFVA